ncbi:MAG: GNAT family N-acetyltransferase [Spirochaetia bacterium]|nr:GNAT family N-acetyltransferase [Spirochaetia bacterium]
MKKPPGRFETKRLLLRRFRFEDAASVYEFAKNELNTKYVAWPTHTKIEHSKSFLEYSIKAFDKGHEFSYGIELNQTGSFIGWIGIRLIDETSLYIGYFIDQHFWNQGYATEAAVCLFEWGREQESITKIESSCHTENSASARVLEKIGLSLIETIPSPHDFPNLLDMPHNTLRFEYIK